MILKNQTGFTRHTGVLISLIILLILLIWNWDVCFAPGVESIYTRITNWIMGPMSADKDAKESFVVLDTGIDETKLEVKVRPDDRSVDVMFDAVSNAENIKGYLLVLAKYDRDLKQVGALKVKISDEGGSTFGEQLAAFTDKYKGVLSATQRGAIKNLNINTDGSVLKASGVNIDKVKDALGGELSLNGNILLTDILMELLNLLYKNQRIEGVNLYSIYNEIQGGKTQNCDGRSPNCALPLATSTENPSGNDLGVSKLVFHSQTGDKYTTEMAKADATQLNRALTEYPDVRNYFTSNTNIYLVNKIRNFMDRLVDLYMNPPITSVNKMCDDKGKCKYTFTELELVDPQGAPYNYKLGVGVIIVDADGVDKVSKIDAYTYGGPKRIEFFKLTNTLEEQTKLVRRLDMVDRNRLAASAAPTPTQALPGSSNEGAGDMDAYMKMLRPYLGDYPNEFQMSKAQMDDVSLSKYLQESLALGQINVNVGISDLAAAPTPTATSAAGSVNFN